MSMETYTETKVIVSAAIDREQREELERLAREGDRTLSQQIRLIVRRYLERTDDKEAA
jgi:hypothetical protein